MNRLSLSVSLLVITSALLAACGAPSADGSSATSGPAQSGDVMLGGGMPLPAAHAAVQALAEARGLAAAEITVISAEAVEWPNACLGAAEPDQACAEVLTPGYRVLLQVGDEQVTFHTDELGAALVLVR